MWPFDTIYNWFAEKTEKRPNDGITRKAVIVGINKYPGAPLAGCVNDANDIRARLIKNYGFVSSDIKLLLDSQAKTSAIKNALIWMTKGLKKGDIVVFWFSGHGTQIPDSGEADGFAESICPFDFNWNRDKMIIDNDFVNIFSTIPQGVIFCWGSDSCHSGDSTKSVADINQNVKPYTPKTMPMPEYIHDSIEKSKSKGCKLKSITSGILDVGFISGCQSHQTSADTVVNGRPCGALTYYFLKNLNITSSLEEVCNKVKADLKREGYDQVPNIEGTRINKPWLK